MSKTMSTMNKDEKRLMLFDMQEHPEKYTDEQVERLLADEEAQEFLRDLAMARMAGKKATPKKVDVDKAWKEFSEKHNKAKSISNGANTSYRNRMQIAASIIGIIFLSGIALAAVQNGWLKFAASDKVADNKAVTAEPKDSLDMKPVVFDNAELGTILTQMADFYHVKVRYDNADTQHVRLFFNWNKTKTLELNLEILNAFDRIQIEYAEGELVVK